MQYNTNGFYIWINNFIHMISCVWCVGVLFIVSEIKGITPKPELCGYALLNFISAKFFGTHTITWRWNAQFELKSERSQCFGQTKTRICRTIKWHLDASVFHRCPNTNHFHCFCHLYCCVVVIVRFMYAVCVCFFVIFSVFIWPKQKNPLLLLLLLLFRWTRVYV